jgi:hypothetical protein
MENHSERIGRMIKGSLEGQDLPKTGETPVDAGQKFQGEDIAPVEVGGAEKAAEGTEDIANDRDVDDAFDTMTERSSSDAVTQAELGGETAARIQKAFEMKDLSTLPGLLNEFTTKGGDLAVLREQLKGFHDAYREAGLDAKASEIDAFSRSLESTAEVKTDAGKQFMADLIAGKFADMVAANNALENLKTVAQGIGPEELEGLNNEFNTLFGAATDYFQNKQDAMAPESGARGLGAEEVTDEDVDDIFKSAIG